jgi:hypothetical protein
MFYNQRGGIVLSCEPCFQALNAFYKRKIRQREEEEERKSIILEDELEN